MRGDDVQQQARFSYLSPEARVPQDHPLRPIRNMVNQAVAELSGEFQAMQTGGRNLRLDENRRQSQEDSAPRHRAGGLGIHPHGRSLQSGANA